jgi:hypothetical protein
MTCLQNTPDGITEQRVAPVLGWSVHVDAANLVFWFKTNNIKADKTNGGEKHNGATKARAFQQLMNPGGNSDGTGTHTLPLMGRSVEYMTPSSSAQIATCPYWPPS